MVQVKCNFLSASHDLSYTRTSLIIEVDTLEFTKLYHILPLEFILHHPLQEGWKITQTQ